MPYIPYRSLSFNCELMCLQKTKDGNWRRSKQCRTWDRHQSLKDCEMSRP